MKIRPAGQSAAGVAAGTTRIPSGRNSGARISVKPTAIANAALPNAIATISRKSRRSTVCSPARMQVPERASFRAIARANVDGRECLTENSLRRLLHAFSSAATPARATSKSWSSLPALTPMAPTTSPSMMSGSPAADGNLLVGARNSETERERHVQVPRLSSRGRWASGAPPRPAPSPAKCRWRQVSRHPCARTPEGGHRRPQSAISIGNVNFLGPRLRGREHGSRSFESQFRMIPGNKSHFNFLHSG